MTKRIFSLFLVLGMLATVSAVVQTPDGPVSGVSIGNGITVFRGIPFAAPPVGDLRWQPPEAPIPWQGVTVADTFGPACMQPRVQLMSEAGC